MQMYYVPRFSSIFFLAALIGVGWFSIHLAVADARFREQTPESVARAVELEPRNASYLALRALQLDYDGADSTAVLEREAALSPMSSAPRIRLGLAAEARGDNATAERWLLEAAGVDRQYEPRWSLASFYFRQQRSLDRAEFWKWMHEALDISYGDRRPTFDLCWRIGDGVTTLSRAIPEKRDVIAQYLWYVLESHRDAVAPAAMKLASFHDPNDRSQLLITTDALIDMRDARAAGELWKAFGNPPPSGITNPIFATAPLQHGFDWRWNDATGVAHTLLEQPNTALRIALDGRKPESVPLLSQIVALKRDGHYTLRWSAHTTGLPDASGVEWNIAGKRAPISANELSFTAPSDLAELSLSYQRPLGQPRVEGSIEISRVELTIF